ncbi:Piso0_004403 [Millerozyma farinosa CBS 7064]|uniref:Piso0_004403 protein n=1 Tax=Pichia sorbitophila (strain ATCC MYA-4447 / BCRC 22081 / CBS 7064 / NBRC 10061 / NRRL Y-12695) TaxID=559304 RepID=G8Y5D4_PICSO|nr:Piso0_004403 [Millerozyma farinosa CBS 7064]CCE84845.1 Piso0_004403 [Millerozyma farinosa CBS 7064]
MSQAEIIIDAKCYLSLVDLISNAEDKADDKLVDTLRRIFRFLSIKGDHAYINRTNILRAIISYLPILRYPIEKVALILKDFQTIETNREQSEFEDLEELYNFVWEYTENASVMPVEDTAILNSADTIASESKARSDKLSYSKKVSYFDDDEMYRFVKSYILVLASGYDHVDDLQPILELVSHNPDFQLWDSGVLVPFRKYAAYCHFYNLMPASFVTYIRAKVFEDQFMILCDPIVSGAVKDEALYRDWMSQIIIPFMIYKQNGTVLLAKLINDFSGHHKDPLEKLILWKSYLTSHIEFKHKLLKPSHDVHILNASASLCSCYFISLKYEVSDSFSFVKAYKLYDEIEIFANVLLDKLDLADTNDRADVLDLAYNKLNISKYPDFEAFFMSSENELQPLFKPVKDRVSFLLNIVKTCKTLFSINKLTLGKYLELKFSSQSYDTKETEIAKILLILDAKNWNVILDAAQIYANSFIIDKEDKKSQIDELTITYFLKCKLFDEISNIYFEKGMSVSSEKFFELVYSYLWTSIKGASNLNDNIGKLLEAKKCVKLLQQCIKTSTVSEENKREFTKVQHLLDAFSKLKHFKIVLVKGEPATPNSLISKYCQVSNGEKFDLMSENSPIGLIGLILEQNPKSYLAFEKLYKVLNDLLLFCEFQFSNHNFYFNKLKTLCIESALVDDNFKFAYESSTELLDYLIAKNSMHINDMWLTFFQVGKYVSPSWFNDEYQDKSQRIQVLIKQRDLISKTIKYIQPQPNAIDNSRLMLGQFKKLNAEIESWYLDECENPSFNNNSSKELISENITNLANEIIGDATSTTTQASEKLSNLFVSGLGWAIGANPH